MKKRFRVALSETEGQQLVEMIGAGTAPARTLMHARILLQADEGTHGPAWVDERIADAIEISQATVSRVRTHYVREGVDAALDRRAPRRVYVRKLDGLREARLIALACGDPPAGQARWSLRLLADRLGELAVVESISYQTVRRVFEQTHSNRG